MDVPRGRLLLQCVNTNEVRTVAAGLMARGGVRALLRLLGTAARPRERRLRSTRVEIRRVRTAARDTLQLHVIDLRTAIDTAGLGELDRLLHEAEPFAHHVLIVCEPRRQRVAIACNALRNGVRHIVIEPRNLRQSDIDVLCELAGIADEAGTAAALRVHRALDRRQLTTRFFRDVRGVRDAISRAWTGLPAAASADRDALALLLLSRLLFLYFLQRRGLLAGDADFLPALLRRWRRRSHVPGTFYRVVLRTLFFGVLNRRPEQRTARARKLGEMPYLNGGLFEQHRLEHARSNLDLPDDVVVTVFDALLQKYRFTTGEPSPGYGIGDGIDPEMLGRIFEGLMPGERRRRTGTFYTPAEAVEPLVTEALGVHISVMTGVPRGSVEGVLRGADTDASDRDLSAIARAAAHVRVLDPACGSGAFLLSALSHLERARHAGRPVCDRVAIRRETVGESLHGVDLLEDAALICSLRLWLSLIPQCDSMADVPPLPNLDRRIRQGDALVDPLDIGAAWTGRPLSSSAPADMRSLMTQLISASGQYLSSGPDSRPALRRALTALERRLARAWLDTLERHLDHNVRELRARSSDVDLFGTATSGAQAARARLPSILGRLEEVKSFREGIAATNALPFFSFRVHFAGIDGFDVVLSNPPWVRAHNWPPAVRTLLRERYRVCSEAGWPYAASVSAAPGATGAQVDLAFLFLERALGLLRDGGTLGIVLPAKLIRSLAPGGARALLLDGSRIASIADHSLDQRAVFDADAFTAVIIARRDDSLRATPARLENDVNGSALVRDRMPDAPGTAAPAPVDEIRVCLTRGGQPELRFTVRDVDLPLRPGDTRSPWLLAPPECSAAFRLMQCAGPAISTTDLAVRRGAMTGANDLLLVRDMEPKLGDLARIRTEGYHRRGRSDRRACSALVEASALRPALRGTDIQPWSTCVQRHVVWTPCNDDRRAAAPPRISAYLNRHARTLNQPAHRLGTLQRLSPGMFGDKVVWSDLAADLRAAAVPASIRTIAGLQQPVVPLNTVYFIGTSTPEEALLLAAMLNSTPMRTFARAIAERAKDAHFRFFAWTVGVLPMPPRLRSGPTAERVISLSSAAHARGSMSCVERYELDMLVASACGLSADDMEHIARFDAWLCGRERTDVPSHR